MTRPDDERDVDPDLVREDWESRRRRWVCQCADDVPYPCAGPGCPYADVEDDQPKE